MNWTLCRIKQELPKFLELYEKCMSADAFPPQKQLEHLQGIRKFLFYLIDNDSRFRRYCLDSFSVNDLNRLSYKDINKYSQYCETMGECRINRSIALVQDIMQFYVDFGYMDHNPCIRPDEVKKAHEKVQNDSDS